MPVEALMREPPTRLLDNAESYLQKICREVAGVDCRLHVLSLAEYRDLVNSRLTVSFEDFCEDVTLDMFDVVRGLDCDFDIYICRTNSRSESNHVEKKGYTLLVTCSGYSCFMLEVENVVDEEVLSSLAETLCVTVQEIIDVLRMSRESEQAQYREAIKLLEEIEKNPELLEALLRRGELKAG